MKRWPMLLVVAVLFLFTVPTFAETVTLPFGQPALITSSGQSPDGLMVKVLLTKQAIQNNYLPQAKVADMKDVSCLIIAVGASTKGLGAAGIDFETELARTKELVAYAIEKKIPVVMVHIGGKSRRGGKSNELIEAVAPYASYMIITSDGNEDGYFTKLSEEKKIPLKSVEKISDTGVLFKEIFVQQ